MKPIVALTVGDYNGIGPEVVLHSAQDERVRRACIPLLIGPVAAFDYYARRYGLPRAFIPPLIKAMSDALNGGKKANEGSK